MTNTLSENKSKYNKVFTDVFSLKEEMLKDDLEYNSIPEWDSLGHMSLIAELEEKFNISMETDDIINFSSFGKGKEILEKYGIKLK